MYKLTCNPFRRNHLWYRIQKEQKFKPSWKSESKKSGVLAANLLSFGELLLSRSDILICTLDINAVRLGSEHVHLFSI